MKKITLKEYCDAGNAVIKSYPPEIIERIQYIDSFLHTESSKYLTHYLVNNEEVDDITGMLYPFWKDAKRLLEIQGINNELNERFGASKKNMNSYFPSIKLWTTFLHHLIKTKIVNEALK